jgi:hypothetical protein
MQLPDFGNLLARLVPPCMDEDRQQHRVDMAQVNHLVAQVDARRTNQPVDHLGRLDEIMLVVRPRHGKGDGKGGSADAAPGAAGALSVIGGRGRHVAEEHCLQVAEDRKRRDAEFRGEQFFRGALPQPHYLVAKLHFTAPGARRVFDLASQVRMGGFGSQHDDDRVYRHVIVGE